MRRAFSLDKLKVLFFFFFFCQPSKQTLNKEVTVSSSVAQSLGSLYSAFFLKTDPEFMFGCVLSEASVWMNQKHNIG